MKKSTYLFAIALGVSTISLAQNVGINTDGSDPDTDALLHLLNTNSTALDPLIRLENQQNASVNGIELLNSGGATAAEWDLYIPSSSTDFRVSNGTTDHVTIQNDGDVGIGTSTPTVPLDIEATNAAIDINNTSTDPLIHFQVSSTTNFTIGTDVTDSKFKIGTTALETGTAITVQSTGEVGIGTTSPTATLDVNGGIRAAGGAPGANGVNNKGYAFSNGGDNDCGMFSSADGELDFYVSSLEAVAVRLPSASDVRVGIGTSSPAYCLDAQGSIRIPQTYAADGQGDSLLFYSSGAFGYAGINYVGGGSGTEQVNSYLNFFTNGSNALAIKQGGEVGIGTSSPLEDLHVDGQILTTSVFWGNNQDQAYLIAGSQSYTGATTDWGTYGFQHRFKSNGSGVARITVDDNSGELFCIENGGNVGIGTSSPTSIFDIHTGADFIRASTNDGVGSDGGFGYSFYIASTSHEIGRITGSYETSGLGGSGGIKFETRSGGTLAERMRLLSNGYLGIAMTSPSVELDVTGDIEYTGTITDVSDRRLKENFSSIDSVLTKIMKIEGLSYNMINDSTKRREYGVIAQDVQAVFPEMVSIVDPENGYLGVAYIQLVPILLEATKKQQAIIEAQKKENESQKAEIENLKQETSSASTNNAKKFAALEAKLNALLLNQNVTLSAKK